MINHSIVFTLILTLILSLFISNSALSQSKIDSLSLIKYTNVAEQIVSSALSERKGYEMLRNLCRIGPRLSGSKNSLIALNWAKNKMKELGFDTVWLQPVIVPHWERGNIEEAILLDSDNKPLRRLNILALGGSIGTPSNGITAKVIEVNSFEELKERKDEANGKIVFFSRPINQSNLSTFTGYSNAADQRVYGAIEAAKYGGVGAIVRSLTTRYDNVPHTGMMSYVDSLPKVPAATIGYLDADFLSEAIKGNPNIKIKLTLDCVTQPDVKSYNVIGEIRGEEFPDEIILVGGHIDSWDVGDGAHDDGAGCVQSIEVLDIFKRLNITPKRTLRTVLFINEETGLTGAKEYAAFADSSKQTHLAAIESDRGAFTPLGFSVDTDSIALIEKLNSWLPLLRKAGIIWIKKGGSGADISQIKNIILPMGYVPDSQRYFDLHHSPNDVFEEVHPREFELGSAAIAIMVYLLSEEGI
ncbi:MAG: M20/M25/M40 family metallo-hydrolase [Ignavibacterium sp.]|nr:MAG: M20/M25/M40 family metallo-hydrolase [Ignavibacterium sp.]